MNMPRSFQLTVQHELEHPATDVVEAVIWELQRRQANAIALVEVEEQCAILTYSKIWAAARNLVLTGRIIPERQRSNRPMGPKWTTKYKVPTNIAPRLMENSAATV